MTDAELGKKGYYNNKEEAELGQAGFYGGKTEAKTQTAQQPKPATQRQSIISRNLPLVLLLIFVIGAISFFAFFYNPAVIGRASFDLVVSSGQTRVANATVQVYDGTNLIGEGVTDSQGRVRFDSLPPRRLEFQVISEQGRSRQAVDLAQLRVYLINLKGKTATTVRDSLTITLKDAATSESIEGAKVSYSLGSGNQRLFADSDAQGEVTLQLQGETVVRLRVVDPQRRYEPRSDVILATRPVAELLLRRKVSDKNIIFAPEAENVSFTLVVNGGVNGQVTMFDSLTGYVLASADIEGGRAQLNATAGSTVTLSVTAPGFYPAQINYNVTAGGQASLTLAALVAEVEKTTLIITDENSTPVASASVNIIPLDSASILLTNLASSNGAAEFTLADGTYYALVTAPGFLPAVSGVFEAGEEVSLTLLRAGVENSATLEVGVVDEDDAGISGASVAIFTDDGRLAALPVQTEFATPARFVMQLGNFEVKASFETQTASKIVQLEGDTRSVHIDLQIRANLAYVDLRVLNLENDLPISAELASFYKGQPYDSCIGSGGCVVAVRSGEDVYVEVSSPGFLSSSYYAESITKGGTKRDSLHLISSAATGLGVDFIGVFDSSGNQVSEVLTAGEQYTAKFFISAANADRLAFYGRLQPAQGNISSSTPHLLEPESVEGIDVTKSTVYLGPHVDCVDLEQTGFEPPYAWMELSFMGKAQEVSIPFKIPVSASENSSFKLRYRGKSTAGNLNARFPPDAVLGFAETSADKADCYAETTALEFQVIRPRAPEITVEFPDIVADFTPGDAVVFDPSTSQIQSRDSLASYELQVDSILPGDAMPLVLQADNRCTVLIQLPNASIDKGENADCYQYDTVAKTLVFATREINPLCPIHLKQDKFYDANENIVTDDSASLTFTASCLPNARKVVPVKVNLVSVPSFAFRPEESRIAEGDAAKLLYTINNRQLPRIVEISSLLQNSAPQIREVQLQRASAKAFAWRGPGSVELAESDALLAEVQFTDSSQVYRPGVGALGFRVSSCASGDVFCCANGWCTRKAVEDIVGSFKEISQRVAGDTAFRRGEGKPFNYFSQEQFKFVTVVQAAQGSQTSLRAGGVNFSSPSPCIAGNPGIYELSAQSLVGTEWNYSAQTLALTSSDYLQPPSSCGSSSNATQPSFTNRNGSLTLCNFLSAVNNCVESTPNATITSLDQVEKLRFSLTNCMYPVFPSAPVCPGTRIVLPAINIINYRSETDFDANDSPKAFEKIFTSISSANSSRFSVFSWQGQLRCIVPPSFQQFAITAGSGLLRDTPDYAAQETPPTPTRVTSDVCARPDFFSFAGVPNLDTLIPLAGICCAGGPSSGATHCTPRRGKFFISVQDNEVKVITQWGLTDGCYPYWPFPTSLRGLAQEQNLVSVGVGLAQFVSSNGANFEMSLASERPGETDRAAAATGITEQSCSSDSDCTNRDQCKITKIYAYSGGRCVGSSSSGKTCVYGDLEEKQTCEGGAQCKQTGVSATCEQCGGVNADSSAQRCCILPGTSNAFCKQGFGCLVSGSSFTCTANCGGVGEPVCGGWPDVSTQRCNSGLHVVPPTRTVPYSTCQR